MGNFMNRGKNLGTGFKNRGPVIEGGSFTNRGAEDQSGREFKNRGQAWFGGEFTNRGPRLLESWSPESLFAASEVGVWYDPSDLSTLFQNSNGTTAVAVGDPVGYIADKSGNGFHATQSTADSRPVLRQTAGGLYYLEFDGTDDFLVTSAIDFSSTDKMSVFAGVRKLSDAAVQALVEYSSGDAAGVNGSFAVRTPGDAGQPRYGFIERGTVLNYANAATYTAPITNTFTLSLDTSGATLADRIKPRINATPITSFVSSGGASDAGNFGNHALNIGRRNTASPLYLNGYLYSLIVRGALSSASEITSAEAYVNSKTGAY